MRIFVSKRMAGKIKKDERKSKGNYGARKGCSIDDLTLEKRLLHDYSVQNMKPTMHDLTDLQS